MEKSGKTAPQDNTEEDIEEVYTPGAERALEQERTCRGNEQRDKKESLQERAKRCEVLCMVAWNAYRMWSNLVFCHVPDSSLCSDCYLTTCLCRNEQKNAALRAKQAAAAKAASNASGATSKKPTGPAAAACVKGLVDARNEFKMELEGVWRTRNEVFYQVWSSQDMMKKLGGHLHALANVITNISNYPDKPFGLQLDQEQFFILMPELSPTAVQAYVNEPGRFYALIKELVTIDWERDADEMHKNPKLADLCIEVGGYKVPFDEGQPVEPMDDGAMAFGSRLLFYSNLRSLFLYQTYYLVMSILLAQAVEKKLIGVEK